MENYYSEQEKIIRRKKEARAQMELQVRAADIRSALVDQLAAEKRANAELAQQIEALKDTNAALYKYIKRLELIDKDIWCSNCESIKNVPGYHVQRASADKIKVATSAEIKSLESKLAAIKFELNDMCEEFNIKIKEMLKSTMEIEQKLAEYGASPKAPEPGAAPKAPEPVPKAPEPVPALDPELANQLSEQIRKLNSLELDNIIMDDDLIKAKIGYTSADSFLGDDFN